MAELQTSGGQPTTGPETVTSSGPEGTTEQSVATQTTTQGSEELTFFDPESIRGKPELESAYKQMQRAFTQKTQGLAEHRKKIEAYEAFESDPLGTMRALAQQYGYQLLQGQQPQQQSNQEFQTWDDVLEAAEKRAEQRILQKIAPVLGKVEKLQQQNIETFLDTNHPDWRTYESEMTDLVKKHPTLAKDPDMLYEMALPPSVRNARATKAALAKIQAGSGASQISGGSSTTKQVSDLPKKGLTFQEAVEYAKRKLQHG